MSVPNTTTFTLQDVVDEINAAGVDSLTECFSAANNAGFDPLYEGSKDNLLNFRNYNNNPGVPVIPVSLGTGGTSQDACLDSPFSSTFYIPTGETFDGLTAPTALYTNVPGSTLAPSGWYSDGDIVREWNGFNFITSGLCGFL